MTRYTRSFRFPLALSTAAALAASSCSESGGDGSASSFSGSANAGTSAGQTSSGGSDSGGSTSSGGTQGTSGSAMVPGGGATGGGGAGMSSGGQGSGAGGSDMGGEPGDFPGTGCNSSAFFCEDFESLEVGAAQASNGWSPEGAVSIDSEATEGQRSLLLQPNGGQFARIVLGDFSPPTNGFYGRMFVRVDEYPTAPNYSHYVLVEATGSGSSERVRPVGGQLIDEVGGLNMWGTGADGGPTGDWTKWDTASETRPGVWECVEWQLDEATSAMNVWIDEQFQTEISTNVNPDEPDTPFVFPEFNSIWFGWWVFQNGTTPAQFNVRLDDIVLSTERIGCD